MHLRPLFFSLAAVFSLTIACPFDAGAQTVAGGDIAIDAARLEVDQKTGLATFSGNVVATQGTTRLTSDRLSATYANGAISELRATGHVRFTRTANGQNETATGSTATYRPASEVLTMSGGVTLTRGGNTLAGSTLTYNVRSGVVNLGGGGRVKGRFQSGGQSLGAPVPTIRTGGSGSGTVSRSFAITR